MVNPKDPEIIYVYLLHEGVDVWRPVEAARLGEDLYRITDMHEHRDEVWEFQSGDVVRCEYRNLSSGKALVAAERIDPESDSM